MVRCIKSLFSKSSLRAVINEVEYGVEITDHGRYAIVYELQGGDFMGRFLIRDNNLVEVFPMSGEEVVIGRLE